MKKNSKKLETSGDKDLGASGNTKKRPNQLKSWFFTLNNYSEEDIQTLNLKFEEICERYIFEEEVGKCGTPHLQGVIFLKKEMRWSEFNLTDRINWGATKKEDKAIKYCQKDYHYEGRRIWYKGITLIKPLEIPYKTTFDLLLESIIKENGYEKRKIFWFWSEKGGCGKTTLFKYFYDKYNYVNIIPMLKASARDLLNCAFGCRGEEPLFIINIPRSCKLTNESYVAIENIKDGVIPNYKSYKNEVKMIRRPIVIVMANYAPKINNDYLSKDRFFIHKIDYAEEVKLLNEK